MIYLQEFFPVSWGIYGDMGHTVCLHTLPEYRRNRFASSISVNLFAQLKQVGIIPVVEQSRVIAGAFGRAQRYIADSTCRDSITGECYW